MRPPVAQKLINETKATYEYAAKEFSDSRSEFWDELTYLKSYAKPGNHVLDLGCGNGRFYPIIKSCGVEYVGVDSSKGLIDIAKNNHPEAAFMVADALQLPFPDESFDIVYAFAVVHHIPSRKLRNVFFKEIARVLRKDGTLIITSWYLWKHPLQYRLFQWIFKNIFFLTPYEVGDIVIGLGKNHVPRYIHAYTRYGIQDTAKKNGFSILRTEIKKRPSGQENIVLVAKKS